MKEDEERQLQLYGTKPPAEEEGPGEMLAYQQLQQHKADMNKLTDTKFISKQNQAVQLALQREDFKLYDQLTKEGKKDDKQFVYDYLGEDMSDGKSLDGKNLNKEYDPKLDQSKY